MTIDGAGSNDPTTAFVAAAAQRLHMPLSPERTAAASAVMRRLGEFAAGLEALELADDVEVAGVFTP